MGMCYWSSYKCSLEQKKERKAVKDTQKIYPLQLQERAEKKKTATAWLIAFPFLEKYCLKHSKYELQLIAAMTCHQNSMLMLL